MKNLKPRAVLQVLFIAVCLLTFKAAAVGQATSESELRFTILHTNDLHSHDDPFLDHGRTVGGMSRIAHLIRSIRRGDPDVVTIDAGDIFQGTPYFKFYHGAVEVEMLNDAGYDIYTVGNHEFDEGPKNLADQLKAARFSIISCNLDASSQSDLAALIKPSVVRTIKGQKVGFVGVITPFLADVALKLDAVKVKTEKDDWVAPVAKEVARLKSEGIDKIILVSHCGVELDKVLADKLVDVDAIIGGHSHTRLDKAIVVPHEDGSHCLIVQTGCYGKALGQLRLAFDNRGQVIVPQTDYRLIGISERIPEDSDIHDYLAQKEKPFAAMRRAVVGVALSDFDNQFRRYPWDSPIGDLICDALAEGGRPYGATIALQNRGGVRGRLEKGIVTQEMVETILPFENHLVIATVKGSCLLAALENSVSGQLGARFLDVHGLKVAYDPAQPSGQRIVYALAQDRDGSWKQVDPSGNYRIATNDYSFHGGESYNFSSAVDVVDTGKRLSTFLSAYLINQKKVAPAAPSRLIPVSDNLLCLTEFGGKKELRLKYDLPGCHLTVVRGSAKGIEHLPGWPPVVPLMQARVFQSGLQLDQSGEYRWRLPLSGPAASAPTKGEEWVAVIVQPPRGSGSPVISRPIALCR